MSASRFTERDFLKIQRIEDQRWHICLALAFLLHAVLAGLLLILSPLLHNRLPLEEAVIVSVTPGLPETMPAAGEPSAAAAPSTREQPGEAAAPPETASPQTSATPEVAQTQTQTPPPADPAAGQQPPPAEQTPPAQPPQPPPPVVTTPPPGGPISLEPAQRKQKVARKVPDERERAKREEALKLAREQERKRAEERRLARQRQQQKEEADRLARQREREQQLQREERRRREADERKLAQELEQRRKMREAEQRRQDEARTRQEAERRLAEKVEEQRRKAQQRQEAARRQAARAEAARQAEADARRAREELASMRAESRRQTGSQSGRPQAATGRQAGPSGIEGQYWDLVRQRLMGYWKLPEGRNWSSTLLVRVQLTINSNGQVSRIAFASRSGDPHFDQLVENTIRRASPMPRFPAAMQQGSTKVGFRFRPGGLGRM